MHVGLVVDTDSGQGGLHQYSLSILNAFPALQAHVKDTRYTIFTPSTTGLTTLNEAASFAKVVQLPLSPLKGMERVVKAAVGNGRLREGIKRVANCLTPSGYQRDKQIKRNKLVVSALRSHGIDWLLCTAPTEISFESGWPYVMPVHDLQHRLHPEFSEVSACGAWESREYLYRNGTRHATFILADSDVGKEDILNFYGPYGVTPDSVKVLPYVPAPYLSRTVPEQERQRVREIYRLPERYLFYPAQLWPHKNHVRLMQAMGLLNEKGIEIQLVLCGTHSGALRKRTYQAMMREAHRLRIARQIHYLGYVPNETMSALYRDALGLVMPTLFGPTNIPIVEAWLFDCPVLTSDIRGIREQVGDAGILVNPYSVESIASGMHQLWMDGAFRSTLLQRATSRLTAYALQDFSIRLSQIIGEMNQRIKEQRTKDNRLAVSP